ncbi:MAG TPA: hypothetical protein VJP02_18960 [Candidatus Sulfotelmatobacter sp.]|nr:hypothetical protein [Candidatus Sulfotelmatobacter sp.]
MSYLTNDQTGTGSASGVVNGRGRLVSAADTSIPNPNFPNVCLLCPADSLVVHPFRWHEGALTDLGALPGVNNSVANWISANGLTAKFSENGLIDPLLGVPDIRAVLWKDGEVIDLGRLEGGFESAAFAVNDRGQVAGSFLNAIPDPFSPFGLQMRAPSASLAVSTTEVTSAATLTWRGTRRPARFFGLSLEAYRTSARLENFWTSELD